MHRGLTVRARRTASPPLNQIVRCPIVGNATLDLSLSMALAALVGVAQLFFLAFIWMYISICSPLPHWLKSMGCAVRRCTPPCFLRTLLLTWCFACWPPWWSAVLAHASSGFTYQLPSFQASFGNIDNSSTTRRSFGSGRFSFPAYFLRSCCCRQPRSLYAVRVLDRA